MEDPWTPRWTTDTAPDPWTPSSDTALTVKGDPGGATTPLTTALLPRYPVDLSHLERLFPGTRTCSAQPARLADETFPSMVHRISRLGSIRRHGGDDDDVRVSWKDSHTRRAVLATVRRWMEEDSRGGRALPGTGRRLGRAGAAMFNWDLEAPGVQIGELLSRKRGSSHTTRDPADTRRHGRRLPGPVSSSVDEDRDDDWGEMVSCPAVDAPVVDIHDHRDDEIVQGVVRGLPNLSYMLR